MVNLDLSVQFQGDPYPYLIAHHHRGGPVSCAHPEIRTVQGSFKLQPQDHGPLHHRVFHLSGYPERKGNRFGLVPDSKVAMGDILRIALFFDPGGGKPYYREIFGVEKIIASDTFNSVTTGLAIRAGNKVP